MESRASPRFTPTRGLRQGDPLSPFLFLLCVEGMSGMLRVAPSISHLFFVDDSIMFVRVACLQSTKIRTILQVFGAESGQQVNFTKSELSFSKNVDRSKRQSIQQILGVWEVDKHSKYLGLPTIIGRSKKFWNESEGGLRGGRKRVGKEVLIKSIEHAIPTYTMVFIFLRRLCAPKGKGEMVFRDMNLFNIAIIARQSWRLIQCPNSLIAHLLKTKYHLTRTLVAEIGPCPSFTWQSIMKTKYHPHLDLLVAEIGPCPSFTWQSIMTGINALGLGLMDKWILRPRSFTPTRNGADVDLSIRVHNRCYEVKVHGVFNSCDVDMILKIPLGEEAALDEWRWFYINDGVFSVQSAYHMLFERQWVENNAEMEGSSSSRRDMERL
ncbi:hypothetical protein V2J09_001367 [Rumex salicifolius]